MKFTAQQIAGILEGEVVGDPNAEVFKLSKIEEGAEGALTFLSNIRLLLNFSLLMLFSSEHKINLFKI